MSITNGVFVGGIGAWRPRVSNNPVFLYDSFSGTDGTNLVDHTADTGATWAIISGFSGHIITGGRIHGATGLRKTLAQVTPASANVKVTFTLTPVTNVDNSETRVLVRAADDGTSYYYVGWVQGTGGGRWTVSRRVGGANAFIANEASNHSLVQSQNYEVVVTVNGTSITVVVDSSTVVDTTDANVAGNGKVGTYTNQGTSTTGYHIANIQAENI